MKAWKPLFSLTPHLGQATVLAFGLCTSLLAVDLDPHLVGSWPGVGLGVPNDVAVAGNYAYMATGSPGMGVAPFGDGLLVVDISNPANPHPVGAFETDLRGICFGVAVSGDYAYLAAAHVSERSELGGCLVVIDVSNPTKPKQVGQFDTEGPANGVVVLGNYAYVATAGVWDGTGYVGGGLEVFDVSKLGDPRRVAGYGVQGGASGVAMSGQYAYVVASGVWDGTRTVGAGLQVIDVNDPAHPQRAGALATTGSGSRVSVSGHYAFVVDHWQENGQRFALRVIDVSAPSAPRLVGSHELEGAADGVTVFGKHAYVYGQRDVLTVFDISDPAHPQRMGECEAGVWWVAAVVMSGSYAYVAQTVGLGYEGRLEVLNISDPTNLRAVGVCYAGVRASAVAVSGSHAYLAADGLHTIDLSDPAKPQRVGSCDTSGWAQDVAISGSYAYVAAGGLRVIDVSHPAEPTLVAYYQPTGSISRVRVSGHLAYVAGDGIGLESIDIQDPTNPQRVAGHPVRGSIVSLAVSGHHACLANEWWDGGVMNGALEVIDLADPAQPQRVGILDGVSGAVTMSGSYAYVASTREVGWSSGLQVIDLSNPSNPRRMGMWSAPGDPCTVVVSGPYAYVAGYGGLEVIDISNPSNPHRVAGCQVNGYTYGVAVSGNYVLISGANGLELIEVKCANPQRLGTHDTVYAAGVAAHGSYAYVADDWSGLKVIEVADPAHPQQTGQDDPSQFYAVKAAVSESLVWVMGAWWDVAAQRYWGSLRLLDVSVPSRPTEVGRYKSTGGELRGAVVRDQYAYLAEGGSSHGTNWSPGGLQVIDISNRAKPQPVGSYELSQDATDVAVSGRYAYLTDRWTGLHVIDVSSPANPQRVAGYAPDSDARSVAVSGNYAYLAEQWQDPLAGFDGGRLEVIDISNPAEPQGVDGCVAGGDLRRVAISGHYAYVADASYGLHVIDIGDPANPRRVGGNSAFTASDVFVDGDRVYVAGGEDGLIILNTYQPPPRLESAAFGDDGFQLVFRAEPGRTIWLQRSLDLKTWEDWVILTATGDSQAVADPSVGFHSCQFYRAIGQ
jgi:hypothetical protein